MDTANDSHSVKGWQLDSSENGENPSHHQTPYEPIRVI
jgi:hypothetical protein